MQPRGEPHFVVNFSKVLLKARTGLYSEISADDVRRAHLEPIEEPSAWLAEELRKAGSDTPICVLPERPMTIPYLQ